MGRRMLGVVVMAAVLALGSVARAIPVVNGGSVVNDFEVVDRWRTGVSGTRNTPGLAYVTSEPGHLYGMLWSKDKIAKLEIVPPAPGVTQYPVVASRDADERGLAYDPNYGDGVLLSHRTYFNQGRGFAGGSDGVIATAEGDDSDVVLVDNSKTSPWEYCKEMCTIPADVSFTGQPGYLVVRHTNDHLLQMEVNTDPDPDTYQGAALPGRTGGEDEKARLLDLNAELGMENPVAVQHVQYPNGNHVLYLLGTAEANPNHLIALTPGPDGKFGANADDVCDDVAVGYYFGETGEGNAYELQRQHITSEAGAGGGPTDMLDIDGSYNTAFTGLCYNSDDGYLYLHGGGDYGTGIVIRDISARTAPPEPVPEPAGLSLLGLALLGIRRRKRS